MSQQLYRLYNLQSDVVEKMNHKTLHESYKTTLQEFESAAAINLSKAYLRLAVSTLGLGLGHPLKIAFWGLF